MDISRRGFLGIGADWLTGGNVTKSALDQMADLVLPGEAEAGAISQKNTKPVTSKGIDDVIKNLTHDDIIHDLNRGLQRVRTGLSQAGYEEAYTNFREIYDKSMAKFNSAGDKFYLKAAVLASFQAGNSMISAASFKNGKFEENISRALLSYEQATAARTTLGEGDYSIFKKGVFKKAVPDEKAINRGQAQANEYLLDWENPRNDTSKNSSQHAKRQKEYDEIKNSLIKLHLRFLKIETNERYHLDPLAKLMVLDAQRHDNYRGMYDAICQKICIK